MSVPGDRLPLPLPIPLPLPGPRGRRRIRWRNNRTGEQGEAESVADIVRILNEQNAARQQQDQGPPEPEPEPEVIAPPSVAPDPGTGRAERRAERRARRDERREQRRARRANRPRNPFNLGNILGGIGTRAPTPTPGQLAQAQREPMSLLGQLGGIVTPLLQAAIQRRAQPSASPMLGPGPGSFGGLVSLPGAGTRAAPKFRTGGTFESMTARANWPRKRRRTNPTNVRALRRALSRVEGFIKIEKRVDKILRRVAPRARAAQRVGFVKRRR